MPAICECDESRKNQEHFIQNRCTTTGADTIDAFLPFYVHPYSSRRASVHFSSCVLLLNLLQLNPRWIFECITETNVFVKQHTKQCAGKVLLSTQQQIGHALLCVPLCVSLYTICVCALDLHPAVHANQQP